MKVLCLFVRHGSERYPNALAQLDAWYARQGLLDQRILWVIDNSLPAGTPPTQLGPASFLRAGDNRAWEFSGWASAIEDARAVPDIEIVHFVTSAFNTLYTGYLGHFRPEMLSYVAARRVCLGHIDAYPTPVTIRGTASSSWIRTCFFFLSRELALSPRPWVGFAEESQIFLEGHARCFRPDAPLSADYQDRITHWLEGGEQGGHQWHSAIGSGEEESQRFRQKTLAILNEHQLSIRLRSEGIALTDFCWTWTLSTPLASTWNSPPDWIDQLRARRRVLGIPE